MAAWATPRPAPAPHPVDPAVTLPVEAATPIARRLWDAAPFAVSVLLASSVLWGPFLVPWAFAVAIVAFFAYWLVRSYSVAVACFIGLRRIRQWECTRWPAKYRAWAACREAAHPWDWPRHLVIIPNYKEHEAGLRRTLDSLAAQRNAGQLVVVLAMEEREPGAHDKASRLVASYRAGFADMFATFHPFGIPGEAPGKGSNEAWAAREAYARLIDDRGDDLARYTITSCDADARFHPRHFEALNHLFLTAPDPYRTFWQPAIFNSNNIWDIPAVLRIPDGLSGINRLSNLILPGSVRFPTSCYSLSWQMLREVDHWDEEVIPEDWHLYLKCAYTLGDRVRCEGLFLPLGNDCVLTDGWWKTLRAHYAQSVRHAWGASDIPYAWRGAFNRRSPLGMRRKLLLAGAVSKVHVLWVAQWYLVTMGAHLPVFLANHFGAGMPSWWLAREVRLPGPNWKLDQLAHGQFAGSIEPWIWLSVSSLLIYFCLFPLLALIVFEYRQRGPRPATVPRVHAALGFLVWPAMAVITFVFASLPALHAQARLALGRGLVYRVAEKGSRDVVAAPAVHPAPAFAHAEPLAEPLGSPGGGQ
jgi:hypothetical protein